MLSTKSERKNDRALASIGLANRGVFQAMKPYLRLVGFLEKSVDPGWWQPWMPLAVCWLWGSVAYFSGWRGFIRIVQPNPTEEATLDWPF